MPASANREEPGPIQEGEVFTRDVGRAVLLPACRRALRSKELQHQRANLTGRLRSALEQPHVTLRHHPIAQICCPNKERLTGGIHDLFAVRVCELPAPFLSPCQKKKRPQ